MTGGPVVNNTSVCVYGDDYHLIESWGGCGERVDSSRSDISDSGYFYNLSRDEGATGGNGRGFDRQWWPGFAGRLVYPCDAPSTITIKVFEPLDTRPENNDFSVELGPCD
jgi:hypothetical protein